MKQKDWYSPDLDLGEVDKNSFRRSTPATAELTRILRALSVAAATLCSAATFCTLATAASKASNAGPNSGGSLILHVSDSISYSNGTEYCAQSSLTECLAATAAVMDSTPVVFHLFASFPETSQPRLKGVTFGVSYDDSLFTLLDHGSCADFEIATSNWPDPWEGSAISWATAQTTNLIEMYWFAGYAREAVEQTFHVMQHPTQGGFFADDAEPPNLDEVAAFGNIGFYRDGFVPCAGFQSMPFGMSGMSASSNYRVFHLEDGGKVTLTVDPGDDDTVKLAFSQAYQSPTPPNMELSVDVLSGRSGVLLDQFYLTLVGTNVEFNPPVNVSDEDGAARLEITATTAGGEFLEITALAPQGQMRDRVQINAEQAALSRSGLQVSNFWVPHGAESMNLNVMYHSNPSSQATYNLYDPSGGLVASGLTGTSLSVPHIPKTQRSAEWSLHILSSGYPYDLPVGEMSVEFEVPGSSGQAMWAPSNAFSMDATQDCFAEFSPHEVMALPDGPEPDPTPMAWYTPFGRPQDSGNPYQVEGRPAENSTLQWFGRQQFTFATWPGVESSVVIYNQSWRNPLAIEYWRDDPDFVVKTEVLPGSLGGEFTITLGGQEPDLFHLRLPKTYTEYAIGTSAPSAVVGPTRGVNLYKSVSSNSDISSEEMTFWVPRGIEEFTLQMHSHRYCKASECYDDDFAYRVYPEWEVRVTDPDGNVFSTTLGESNHGRGDLTCPVGDWGNHPWRLEAEVSGSGVGELGECNLEVLMDPSLGRYLTWLGAERLGMPVASFIGERMTHGEPNPAVWSIVPEPDRYFSSTTVSPSDVVLDPSPEISAPVSIVGNASKEVQMVTAYPWSAPSSISWLESGARSFSEPVYAVPLPSGIDANGDLRPVAGGVPQRPQQFISLRGPVFGCWNSPDQQCLEQMDQNLQKDFLSYLTNNRMWLVDQLDGEGKFANVALTADLSDWQVLEGITTEAASRENILLMETAFEPLDAGISALRLHEATYRIRSIDTQHPVYFNEEPTLLHMAETSTAINLWHDEDYYWRGRHGRRALCELVNRAMELSTRVRPGQGTGMSQLAGFEEDGVFAFASPDAAALQMLGGVMLGLDFVGQFLRVQGDGASGFHDLMNTNEPLWTAYDWMIPLANEVEEWMNGEEPYLRAYEIAFGPDGASVPECEYPPVLYGVGEWMSDTLDQPGRWFVVCNFAETQGQQLSLPWSTFEFPDGASVSVELDRASSSFGSGGGSVNVVADSEIEFTVPAAGWVVGRAIWSVDPASTDDVTGKRGASEFRVVDHVEWTVFG